MSKQIEGWAYTEKSVYAHYFRLHRFAGCGQYYTDCSLKTWFNEFLTEEPKHYCPACLHSQELGEHVDDPDVVDFDVTVEGLPPNQIRAKKWPILHLGSPPDDIKDYTLTINGLVNNPQTFTLKELSKLPQKNIKADMHCVMRWTIKDLVWRGVMFSTIVDIVKPKSNYIIAHAHPDYTTNIALSELENAIIALKVDGKLIEPIKGGPLRLVVPHLYAWKSPKWLTRIEFTKQSVPGTWESKGLSMTADAFKEERFADPTMTKKPK